MTQLRVSWSGNEPAGLYLVHQDKNATPAERDARCEMFAAAPDMLAALKALYDPRANGWNVTDWDLRMAEARAAIAKAEGRS